MEILFKNLKFKYIFTCIFVTFVISCLISIAPISIEECKCNNKPEVTNVKDSAARRKLFKYEHRLAILVPFRDRFEELLIFAPHMKKFLDKQDINYHIFILNQIDRYRFNRASLINVGFLETQKDFDYIAMHDVDLLPMNSELQYFYPDKGPLHISSPGLHPRYHYPTFIGGILLVKREHFLQVNGMSNKYWGWGLEDDEFYVRLKEAGLDVTRPPNLLTGTTSTFKHVHDRNYRKRDMVKCFNQREVTRKRDRQTGLHNVAYKLEKSINATITDTHITILNISLMCDESITPWCVCESVSIVKEKKVKTRR
ncbi:beta-1,4-galactosyltransferase 7 [Phymastichus coffea]|uniref:beta-1,4-galactosyltransferase 7 n=1 Tax=Phymastichus coffea TaxID=108790 RepID=UPI00273C264B|nr:beta-1,4-galactosyltransferase 7 [Phymastichus coffea]